MGLLARAKEKPLRTTRLGLLSQDQLGEINSLLEAWFANEDNLQSKLPSKNDIRRLINDEFGVTIPKSTFNEYVSERQYAYTKSQRTTS